MQLLYISTFMFHDDKGVTLALPSCADGFFQKYLGVFDSVRVLGEEVKGYLSKSALVRMQAPNICVRILPSNTRPRDFRNDGVLKKLLEEEISRADAILIKPASRRGMMAIRLAEKLGRPYMIEMTGDIHNALSQSSSLARRLYASFFYEQIKRAIRRCPFALYVSKDYLQSKYPIAGRMCGCADVVLEKSDPAVLARRLERIEAMEEGGTIRMALVGFYQGNGKGVDTALRAMARLPERFELSVLGNGTEESRSKWYEYARARGVKASRLYFPEPLPSASAVLHWLDEVDFLVLPTRSEGLSRTIAEAMSRGLPCLATNICTMPELLEKDCLFELDDDVRLAELLLRYSADKELMKKTACVNFEHARDYDAELLKSRRDSFLIEFREHCMEHQKRREGA